MLSIVFIITLYKVWKNSTDKDIINFLFGCLGCVLTGAIDIILISIIFGIKV